MLEALTGATAPDRRRALQTHLAACPTCQAEAAALEETVTLVRSAPEPRLIEGHWADFMAGLDRRLAADRLPPWPRFLRWVRTPRHAWATAAATSAVAVAVVLALLGRPSPQVAVTPSPPEVIPRGYVTEAVRVTMPAMTGSLAVWKAGINAFEVSYDTPGGP